MKHRDAARRRGFSPCQLAHGLGHANLALAVAPPLVMLLLHELLGPNQRRPWQWAHPSGCSSPCRGCWARSAAEHRSRDGGGAGVVAVAAPADRLGVGAPCVRGGAGLYCCGGGLLAVPLALQFLGPYRISGPLRDPETPYGLAVELFLPTRLQALAPSMVTDAVARYQPNILEPGGFLAPLLLVGVAAVSLRQRQPWVVPAALTGLTCFSWRSVLGWCGAAR